MNKKILIAILIVSIYIPSILQIAFLHFQILQLQEKGRMLVFAENKKVLLKFSINETFSLINWKEKNEFEYNGQMYDVYEKKIIRDSVFILCYFDNEETTLRNELKLAFAGLFGENTIYKKNLNAYNDFVKSLFPPDNYRLRNDFSCNKYTPFYKTFNNTIVIQKILKPPIAHFS